jgi:hypothetical protein
MSRRTAAGGLIAGSIINLRLILGARYYEGGWSGLLWALRRTNILTILLFLLPGFIQGFCLLWIYAACASRYGSGTRAAVRAALLVWVLSDLPLLMELIAPYRLRPASMAAIDLALMLAASIFSARWHRAA